MNEFADELFRDYERSLLALVIWREARGEGYEGMAAVACSIRNRVERPSWWGRSWAQVITKKWQYSAMAAPGDPQLILYPTGPQDQRFGMALEIAARVMSGSLAPVLPGADSYFDTSIPAPKWATVETFVGQVGRLRFHNVDRDYEAERIESELWP